MIRRRTLLTGCVAVVLIAAAPLAQANDTGAAAFIQATGKRAIESVAAGDLSLQQREDNFRKIFRDAFDVSGIARFAIGRYWRVLPNGKRDEYIGLFETYVVKAYASRFQDYHGEILKVTQVRDLSPNSFLVLSEIDVPNGPPVRVNWRVRAEDAGYKITDVIVEGVSMSVTQRDEFQGVIRNHGGQVDALLQALRKKTGQG